MAVADLDVLINNFRLLELAGAASPIAQTKSGTPEGKLWLDYAQAARSYHSWIADGDFDSTGLLKITDPAGAGSDRGFHGALVPGCLLALAPATPAAA